MSSIRLFRTYVTWKIWLPILLVVLAGMGLVAVRVGTGTSLGVKGAVISTATSVKHLGLALLDSGRVKSYSRGQYTNIIFLHHSVGQNLIQQGDLKQQFAKAGLDLWDHGYNGDHLVDPAGNKTGYSYTVPDDNTDPDGLARIFSQSVYPLPLNTFSALLQYEVIAFKSCFPVSNITTDEQLVQYKAYYLSMRSVMDQHPDKVFVILTQPPLNPAETTPDAAVRARAFAYWLTSDEYLKGHPNLFAFDFFDQLAEANASAADYNMLRQAYRDGTDSHPNRTANETIAPLFVDYVVNAVQQYRTTSLASR